MIQSTVCCRLVPDDDLFRFRRLAIQMFGVGTYCLRGSEKNVGKNMYSLTWLFFQRPPQK